MPPLVGGGMRKGSWGVLLLLLTGVTPVAPPLAGRGGEACRLKGPKPLFTLPTIDPSDELGDVMAVGGDGGAEVELVGDEAAERMALWDPTSAQRIHVRKKG